MIVIINTRVYLPLELADDEAEEEANDVEELPAPYSPPSAEMYSIIT